MKSNTLNNLLKRIPLKTKIKVLNEMAFITLLSELGFRENKMWTPDEDELLAKLMEYSEKHTEHLMKEIEEHNEKQT